MSQQMNQPINIAKSVIIDVVVSNWVDEPNFK